MSLLLVWNLVQRFWIPIAIAAAFGLITAWHFNAIHKAVKANDLEWQVKNKIAADAWAVKLTAINNATRAKEAEFTQAVTTITAAHEKENNDAKVTLAAALSRPRLRDPYNSKRPAATCQTETRPVAGTSNEATGTELSIEASNFLRTEAARADEIVRESNTVKSLLIETYRVCSQ